MILEHLNIFPNGGKKGKQPDYKISTKNEGGSFIEVGACWLKEGTKGKYLSCSVDKKYRATLDEIPATTRETPTENTIEYPKEDNKGEIPF